MKKGLALSLGFLGLLASSADSLACGDKLVVVGRGLRASRIRGGPQRASILLYADPKGALPAALDEGHLRKDLERAGHRLRSVGTREELKSALGTGTYDLLFVDAKTATLVEAEAREASSKPTVLPTLFNPSEAELAAVSRQYQCVVKAPGQQKDYLSVVNEALAARAKQPPAQKK